MKQRLISAAVALVLLAAVFACYQTVVLNIAVGLIAGMAVFELLHATGDVGSKAVLVFSVLYGFLIPFFGMMPEGAAGYITLLYLVLLVGMLLWRHNEIRFEGGCGIFFPLGLGTGGAFLYCAAGGTSMKMGFCICSSAASPPGFLIPAPILPGGAFGKHKMSPPDQPP